jgi:ATP-dependent Clp protease ATP-binding subunit ClpC
MFERFSDAARRVVVAAQDEARFLNHNYIGTEHLLLGLLAPREGVAARALESLGISRMAVARQVEEIIGRGDVGAAGQVPFTPRSKKVLELALREAMDLKHNHIGTEHILLGLIREGEGVAAKVLVRLGADLGQVRQRVMEMLSGGSVEVLQGEGPPKTVEPRCPRCLGELADHATYVTTNVPDTEGANPRPVTFVYCGRCGVVISGR